MTTVTQLVDQTDFAALTTTFLDSAAALETRLHDTERRVQSLKRELRRAQHGQERARQWIVVLRRSHRRDSHATTGKLFTRALSDLTALDVIPEVGLKPVTTSMTLLDSIAV